MASSIPLRPRFAFLDGIRGLAALIVVLHHVYLEVAPSNRMPVATRYLFAWLLHGDLAVAVFIVLSGFCLALPTASGAARPTFKKFIFRRSRRILPPYYASLVATLALIYLLPTMRAKTGSRWDVALPAFSPMVVTSHVLMFHDFSSAWSLRINPPMWTVAVEWQIYFAFILVLLPIWQRFGVTVAVAIAFGIGLLPLAFHHGYDLHPWYLGLFAVGMAAAQFACCRETDWNIRVWRYPVVVGWTGVLIVASFCPAIFVHKIICDTILGVLTALSIVVLAHRRMANPLGVGMLDSAPFVLLGTFSYSLYLVHFPIVSFLYRSLPLRIFLVAVLPSSLVVAYVFHLAFERPFQRGH
ncbi:MAG: acyltransferase [Planctomycetota bacterium]|nr:acyltransferase [Planctomycetota bacterium]